MRYLLDIPYDKPRTLEEATLAENILLVFEVDPSTVGRPIAHGYVLEDGFAFADMGWWDLPPFHPFHVLPGKIAGTGPWWVGDGTHRIRQVTHGDPLSAFWNAWAERQARPETRDPDRETCWRCLQETGLLEVLNQR